MRVRAMATAVLLFVANLIGYGFGPSLLVLSPISSLPVALQNWAWRQRNRSKPVPSAAIGELSETLQNVCGEVYSQSLQSAMVIMALLYTASSLFFLLTWRRLDKDMVNRNQAKTAGGLSRGSSGMMNPTLASRLLKPAGKHVFHSPDLNLPSDRAQHLADSLAELFTKGCRAPMMGNTSIRVWPDCARGSCF